MRSDGIARDGINYSKEESFLKLLCFMNNLAKISCIIALGRMALT